MTPPSKQERDELLAVIVTRYAKRVRREARWANIIHVTQWAGAITLGLIVGAMMIAIYAFVGDIPLRGW